MARRRATCLAGKGRPRTQRYVALAKKSCIRKRRKQIALAIKQRDTALCLAKWHVRELDTVKHSSETHAEAVIADVTDGSSQQPHGNANHTDSITSAAAELISFMRASDEHFFGQEEDMWFAKCKANPAKFWWRREQTPERRTALKIMKSHKRDSLQAKLLYAILLRIFFRKSTMKKLKPVLNPALTTETVASMVDEWKASGEAYLSVAYRQQLAPSKMRELLQDVFAKIPSLAEKGDDLSRQDVYKAIIDCRQCGPLTAVLVSADIVYYGLAQDDLPLNLAMGIGAKKGMWMLNLNMQSLPTLQTAIAEQMPGRIKRLKRDFDFITLEHVLCKYHRYCSLQKRSAHASGAPRNQELRLEPGQHAMEAVDSGRRKRRRAVSPSGSSTDSEGPSSARNTDSPPVKKTRLTTNQKKLADLDAKATQATLEKQSITEQEKMQMLQWKKRGQISSKRHRLRKKWLKKFQVYFLRGVEWEDLLESGKGNVRRPSGWEQTNFPTLQRIDDPFFLLFVYSRNQQKWVHLLTKAQGLLEKALQNTALLASIEAISQLRGKAITETRERNAEKQARRRMERAKEAGDEVNAARPLGAGNGDKNDCRRKESWSFKAGYDAATYQVGYCIPAGNVQTVNQRARVPRPYAETKGGMSVLAVSEHLRQRARPVLTELFEVYKMFLPSEGKEIETWKQACAEVTPKDLPQPGWTLNWGIKVASHCDPMNQFPSLTFIQGAFQKGDSCFPSLNLVTSSPHGTIFMGWTDMIEHYVGEWEDLEDGQMGCRASWVFHMSRDLYREGMKIMDGKGFWCPAKLLEEDSLVSWRSIEKVTGLSVAELEKGHWLTCKGG